jgi:hypothetical protein
VGKLHTVGKNKMYRQKERKKRGQIQKSDRQRERIPIKTWPARSVEL